MTTDTTLNTIPCPICRERVVLVTARPTDLPEWPHVVLYRHRNGRECEDWRGAQAAGIVRRPVPRPSTHA